MAIACVCPGCAVQLTFEDGAGGSQTACPNCRAPLTVPDEVVDAVLAEPPAPSPAPPPAPAAAPKAVPDARPRQPCPLCGELIVPDVAKCRFCGAIFDPELKQELKRQEVREKTGEDPFDLSAMDKVLGLLCAPLAFLVALIFLGRGQALKAGKMVGLGCISTGIWITVVTIINVVNRR
jgi:hypothetical protein